MKYSLHPKLVVSLLAITLFILILRLYLALELWSEGNSSGLESYPFMVIFPSTLILALALMSKAKTKEGLLMRLGCMIQLLLIISIPPLSLHLLLGFPVVFLVVELFKTKVPTNISASIEKALIK
ncbi:hypothetical protein ACJJIK_03685 [Microbulbifer sp. ZKSA006]|uniref:hypothetical protein n=1 Tax=Microbulbifer sp. ZKSA006 TaxID=3243390 RepID=UPI00403A4DDE